MKRLAFPTACCLLGLYAISLLSIGLTKDWKNATTCVVDHGANPGLISHFAKQGLVDIARRMIADKIVKDPERTKRLIKDQDFAQLAMETGVKVIHCAEHDTQISRSPKKVGEFPFREVAISFLRILLASVAMGVVCYFSWEILKLWIPGKSTKVQLLQVFGSMTVATLAYLGICFVCRVQEVHEAVAWFKKKRKPSADPADAEKLMDGI